MSILTDRTVSAGRVKAIVFGPMGDALRNHLVTLAYVDMGREMAELLGADDANWTCLAVWPSFTVGETIRATDDPLGLKRMLGRAQSDPLGLARETATSRVLRGRPQRGRVLNRSLAAGNRGVFFEIGLCWADFLATFGQKELSDEEGLAEFRKFAERIDRVPQPPGKLWPEGNRDQLKKGFAAYIEAMGCTDAKRKAELILLGNICMGDHEQRRLQEWLDLSLLDPIRVVTKPVRTIAPDELVGRVERAWSLAMTRHVFVVKMDQETVRVGRPVPLAAGQYPAPLDTLDAPEVQAEYDRVVNGGGGAETGAHHWNDFDDRMSFIASLFRARQRAGLVGVSPYTPEQEEQIWAEAAAVAAKDAELFEEFEGALLLPRSDAPPWSPEVTQDLVTRLDAGRRQCDPPVDDAIERFYRGSGIPRTDRHFTDVLMAIAKPDGQPDNPVTAFLHEQPVLPKWADLDRLRRAQDFFATFRPSIHASLFFGSMFLGYAAGNGVQVLALVSDLTNSPERRIWESTRFVEDVCTTPFWERDSAGWKSLRGVRVYHGSMRAMIESGSQHIKAAPEYPTDRVWDPAWGRPINQEDMFGYCLTMAVPTIENLDRMGAAIDAEQAVDWLHLWNVLGALMGVDETLLTSPLDPERDLSLDEARYALDIILARNVRPTIEGRQLTSTLLEQIGWFPGPLQRVARTFIRSSIGDRNADMLGVPPRGLLEPALSGAQNLLRTLRQNRAYSASSRRLTEWLGEEFLDWWHQEYKDTPPYRQGGTAAITARAPDPGTRQPRQISITIDSVGELPPEVTAAIRTVDEIDLREEPVDDEYESLDMQTLLQGTVPAGAAVGALVTAVRSSTQSVPSVREVTLTIDGRRVPLSQLTDEEVNALLPELTL